MSFLLGMLQNVPIFSYFTKALWGLWPLTASVPCLPALVRHRVPYVTHMSLLDSLAPIVSAGCVPRGLHAMLVPSTPLSLLLLSVRW